MITLNSGSTIDLQEGFVGFPAGSVIQGTITVTGTTAIPVEATSESQGGDVRLR